MMPEPPVTPTKSPSAPAAPSTPLPAAPRFPIEEEQRLSRSMLWRLQRNSYGSQGQQAWHGPEKVPWFVTSNSFVAGSFARAMMGFLRDCASSSGPFGPVDRSQPITIVELCAGSGHFGYLFVSQLAELVATIPSLAALKIRYVMTDLVRANVDAWAAHERMKPFVERGILDFATFDLEGDTELKLLTSGETLGPKTLKNPLGVIANYAFDSTRQDAFRVREGVLHESLVSILSTRKEDGKSPDAGTVGRLSYKYEAKPIQLPYYEQPVLDRILERYSKRLGNTSFLLPVGALSALSSLADLSAGRLYLLSADKGMVHEDELSNPDDPQVAVHGQVFSLMVNYHAIGGWFEGHGGTAMLANTRDARLRASGFLLGATGETAPETRAAFDQSLGRFSVYDYFTLVNGLRPKDGFAPTLESILALLRLSNYDYNVVLYNSNLLTTLCKTAPGNLRRDLAVALEKTWARFFPMDRDLPFEIGRIYSALERPVEALGYYKESLRLFGEHEATYFNAGLCLHRLKSPREALAMIEKALERKPGYGPAREWRNRLETEVAQLQG